jgi:low temperature requirement protein LtrA
MARRRSSRVHLPRVSVEMREHEVVKPLELYFDLVFVLGFTQCTALMAHEGTWTGVGQGLLVLALLWWAWTAYAWLTTVVDPEEGPVRIAMFAAMAALLVTALCVPDAFGDRALPFALAYGAVRLGQIALYIIASRTDVELRHSVLTLALSTTVSIGLLVGGSFLDESAQEIVWTVALIFDMGGPAVFGLSGWRLVPGHFAERHGLVIILALGESIVVLGFGAEVGLTAGVITAAVLGVSLASALWWMYFDVVSLVTARRLMSAPEGVERNRLARNSYSYLHFPMVAGIILVAFGLEETIAHVADEPDVVHAFVLLGGVAIYLLAHVVLRLQNAHTLNVQRFVLALVLLACIPVAMQLPMLATLAGVNVLVWLMIAYEHHLYDERRYLLRHGLDVDGAGSDAAPDAESEPDEASPDLSP